jgi:archaellum biogenesis ATPase FlaH
VREKHVLSSTIKDRAAFMQVADHVERDDLSEQGWIIWESVCDYYDADTNAGHVDPDLLGEAVARKVAADKHKEAFRALVTDICGFEASPANVVADLLETKRQRVGHELAAALLAGDSAGELFDQYDTLLAAEGFGNEEDEEQRRGLSVRALVEEGFDRTGLVQVLPESLNRRLDGGVRPGHHIVLYARPEMGKTMMTIEMMVGFLLQGLTVLYIGNEDPIDDVNMRIINRMAGMTKQEVMEDPDRADEIIRPKGYDNLILASLTPGTAREVTALVEQYEPHVLVLDQLRNLNMHDDNRVIQLEKAATKAREWAKRYSCVVVSVTQAGDSASGKAILDLGDVDYSNTGIPSQADLMVGLGASDQNKMRGEVVISLPKNKISGDHSHFAVLSEPHLSKFVSLE